MMGILKRNRSNGRSRLCSRGLGPDGVVCVFQTLSNSKDCGSCVEQLERLMGQSPEAFSTPLHVQVLVELTDRFGSTADISRCAMSILCDIADMDSSCRDRVVTGLGGIHSVCAMIRNTGNMKLLRSIGSAQPPLPFNIYDGDMIDTIRSEWGQTRHVVGIVANMTMPAYGERGVERACRQGLVDALSGAPNDGLSDEDVVRTLQLIDNVVMSSDEACVDTVVRSPFLLGVLHRSVVNPLVCSDIFRICGNLALGSESHRTSVYAIVPYAVRNVGEMQNSVSVSEAILFIACILRGEIDVSRCGEVMSILKVAGHSMVSDAVSAEIYCVCADYARDPVCKAVLRESIVSTPSVAVQIQSHTQSPRCELRLPSQFFAEALNS